MAAKREAAFSVIAHSIHDRASQPAAIVPMMLSQLQGLFQRERHPLQSTAFSFSRSLAPHLSDHAGCSLFMDCDMRMRKDVAKLRVLRDERYAVMVVKHHQPTAGGQIPRRAAVEIREEKLVERDAVQQCALPPQWNHLVG